ncbi:MAG: polysaccharide pyruvyl transferase family protein [bacterium]
MKKFRLFYSSGASNFGDNLNVIIFEKFIGYELIATSRLFSEGLGIGSLLETFLQPDNTSVTQIKCNIEKSLFQPVKVFGSGFIAPPGNKGYLENFRRKLIFLAVRGKLSKERIEKIEKKTFENLPLGDPGLLLPFLLDYKKINKKYKYGIIPHYVDINEQAIHKLVDVLPDSIFIDVTKNTMSVAKLIAECEIVISSAMHGLIAADSMNIPNVWVKLSNRIEGENYKFDDYYSAYNIKRPPVDLNSCELNENGIRDYIDQYSINPDKVQSIQESLIKAFSQEINSYTETSLFSGKPAKPNFPEKHHS